MITITFIHNKLKSTNVEVNSSRPINSFKINNSYFSCYFLDIFYSYNSMVYLIDNT